jgi:hypothetical protein
MSKTGLLIERDPLDLSGTQKKKKKKKNVDDMSLHLFFKNFSTSKNLLAL